MVKPIIRDLLTMIKEILGNRVEIEYRSVDDERCPYDPKTHYNITPYAFNPKIAKKYAGKYFLDMGQGILQCIQDLYKKYHPLKDVNGVYE